ncbi:MAG: DNA helicase UvrD [Gammaproteobacteria bacterium]|nr:MAG: DNA helicase UvrD [Gammaproteobacteria bacterium]
MNAPAPRDAAERLQALDPARSFIVQAPAGSGKTELLTNRYLNLLAHVDHPEEVVAITFTRKAAAEMRSRVLLALESGAREARPVQTHKALTWDLARAVLTRDARAHWDIRANPGRLRIGTIDSFCSALTRQMPLLSRLGAPPAIVEDAEPLYREAARNLIGLLETDGSWSPAIEQLLLHLDNHLPRVEELLARMLARRDQWLRHLADRGSERLRRETLEAALARLVRDVLATLRATVPRQHASELLATARDAAQRLKADGSDSAILACLDLRELPGDTVDDLPAWRGLAQLLLTASGSWRKRVDTGIGFPPPSGARDAAEKARRESAKRRFVGLVEALADHEMLRVRLAALALLPPPRYDDNQWQVVEALCELLPLAVAQLRLVFQAHGEVDFTEVAWGAIQALGTPDEPTDLALSLDYRIRHLLVDEFQDTSQSQFELLERLTAGWEPGDGRTLFVVGDPMQSIYRFRQAEVGLYLRARHEGIGRVRLAPLDLKVNFRSQSGLVEWVNHAFARVLPATEDIAAGAVCHASAVAQHPALPDAAVCVHPFIGQDDIAEAKQVAALARAALAADTDKTVAILVRSRSHLYQIAPHLKQTGLRFRAVEIEQLGHRSAVQDLLALTRALVHPADRVAWLAVLRAPWCGLTLTDLEALVGDDVGITVWERLLDAARRERLSADGRGRLARVQPILAAALADRRRQPLRRAIEGAWLALGGSACVAERTDLEDAAVYFDLLDELEEGGDLPDLAQLEEQVTQLFALPDVEADARLQLMTVHKAKGLEFHTVIVPGLGRLPRRNDPPLLLWLERTTPRAHAPDLLLAPIRASGSEQEPIYNHLWRLDQDKGYYEDGRLLYVAATRAIERLHLLGHTQLRENGDTVELAAPDPRSLLYQLWPAVCEEFELAFASRSPVAIQPAEPAGTTGDGRPVRRLPLAWRVPAPPLSLVAGVESEMTHTELPMVEFEWASEAIRHVGTVVHRVLQHIAREGAERWTAERLRGMQPTFDRILAELGVPAAQRSQAVARVERALQQTLIDTRGRWLLDAAHAETRSELALSGVLDGDIVNVILDRTFVDENGTRWIVDYKTSAHEGGGLDEFLDREQERYRFQLERYARLMARLDSRPIRLGLYFPLLGGWREWTPGGRG